MILAIIFVATIILMGILVAFFEVDKRISILEKIIKVYFDDKDS